MFDLMRITHIPDHTWFMTVEASLGPGFKKIPIGTPLLKLGDTGPAVECLDLDGQVVYIASFKMCAYLFPWRVQIDVLRNFRR